VLRLWVSSVDYSSDVPLGNNILKQMADVYRKIRNTARFLLGNLHDFDPAKDAVPYDQLPELDRYMLHRMTEVFADIDDAFQTYQFFRFFQTVQNFCVVDLSNFYLDIAKDRLYISAADSPPRAVVKRYWPSPSKTWPGRLPRCSATWRKISGKTCPTKRIASLCLRPVGSQLDPTWKQPDLAEQWGQLARHSPGGEQGAGKGPHGQGDRLFPGSQGAAVCAGCGLRQQLRE
jgi:isoleucyl-tRNA synthetase